MTRKLDLAQLDAIARIVEVPRVDRETDRTFGLPTRLYVLTGAAYFSFVAVMAAAFSAPGMVVPIGICLIYLTMFFAVPALWPRINPPSRSSALGWNRFRRDGIITATGRISATDATLQVLVLPTMILSFGLVVAVVAAVAG